jgi:hypothetical protein
VSYLAWREELEPASIRLHLFCRPLPYMFPRHMMLVRDVTTPPTSSRYDQAVRQAEAARRRGKGRSRAAQKRRARRWSLM